MHITFAKKGEKSGNIKKKFYRTEKKKSKKTVKVTKNAIPFFFLSDLHEYNRIKEEKLRLV